MNTVYGGIITAVVAAWFTRYLVRRDKKETDSATVTVAKIRGNDNFMEHLIARLDQVEKRADENERDCHKRIEQLENQIGDLRRNEIVLNGQIVALQNENIGLKHRLDQMQTARV